MGRFEQAFAILTAWLKEPADGWMGGMVVSRTVLPHLADVSDATERYLGTLTELRDADLRAPSLLPGWSRGHVVTHLARNADALARALAGARAGVVRAMYPSQEQRDAEVEAGAGRPADVLRADARESADRLRSLAESLTAAQLEAPASRTPGDPPWPVRRVGVMRRREVEVHHADLGVGYAPQDWPADFVDQLLTERVGDLTAAGRGMVLDLADREPVVVGDGGPVVSGAAPAVLWWLLGRGEGEGLACSEGRLPEIGKWR